MKKTLSSSSGRNRVVAVFVAAVLACVAPAGERGGPSFTERRLPVGFTTSDVVALDVARDGRSEAVFSGGGSLTVVAGPAGDPEDPPASGGFRVLETVSAGESATGLAAGDLDGDGWIDLVAANHETDHVTLLFGSRAGFAGGRTETMTVGVDPHPHAVRLGDLDGDGHLDLVVDDRGAEALKWFRGRGDGSFDEAGAVDVGRDPYRGMALADLDGDGDLDVVTPNPRAVAVRLNDGTGRFTPAPDLRVEGVAPFGLAVADVDGDGRPDVGVGGGEGQGSFAVWLGAGDGTFTLEPGSPRRIPEGPAKVRSADVDGDGTDDFVVTSWTGGAVTFVVGGGERGPAPLDVGENPWGVAAADFDGDGLLDLAVADGGADEVTFLLARPR